MTTDRDLKLYSDDIKLLETKVFDEWLYSKVKLPLVDSSVIHDGNLIIWSDSKEINFWQLNEISKFLYTDELIIECDVRCPIGEIEINSIKEAREITFQFIKIRNWNFSKLKSEIVKHRMRTNETAQNNQKTS